MKKIHFALAALLLAGFVSAASAGVINFAGSCSEDFNGMGTGTAAPNGWSVYNITGTHDQFKPTDDPTGTGAMPTGNDIKAGTLVSTLTAATPGTQKAAVGYNWAVGGSTTERSLGTSPTGNAGMVLELALTNSTGAAITDLSFDYDIRTFSTTTMNNSYPSNNYVGIEELPGYMLFYSLDNGATYTNATALNSDGHTWANAIGTVHKSLADLSLSGTWNNGSIMKLRWLDDNAQGPSPDQLIGLDNVQISAVPEPGTITLLGLGALAALAFVRRRQIAK